MSGSTTEGCRYLWNGHIHGDGALAFCCDLHQSIIPDDGIEAIRKGPIIRVLDGEVELRW